MTPESILNRVASNRQLTLSQETVVLGFFGCVDFSTFCGALVRADSAVEFRVIGDRGKRLRMPIRWINAREVMAP